MSRAAAELNNLAVELYRHGNVDAAIEIYEEALRVLVDSLENSATPCRRTNPTTVSIVMARSCLRWKAWLGGRQAQMLTLLGSMDSLASSEGFMQNLAAEALLAYQALPDRFLSLSDPFYVPHTFEGVGWSNASAFVLYNMAIAEIAKDNVCKAAGCLEASLRVQQFCNNQEESINVVLYVASQYHLGSIYIDQGRKEGYRRLLDAVALGREKLGHHSLVASLLHQLGQKLLGDGHSQEAYLALQEACLRFHRIDVDTCSTEATNRSIQLNPTTAAAA